jgi:hypothetical protein
LLLAVHQLVIPQDTLTVLLRRACKRGLLKLEFGKYSCQPACRTADPPTFGKSDLQNEQERLSEALAAFAGEQGASAATSKPATHGHFKTGQR